MDLLSLLALRSSPRSLPTKSRCPRPLLSIPTLPLLPQKHQNPTITSAQSSWPARYRPVLRSSHLPLGLCAVGAPDVGDVGGASLSICSQTSRSQQTPDHIRRATARQGNWHRSKSGFRKSCTAAVLARHRRGHCKPRWRSPTRLRQWLLPLNKGRSGRICQGRLEVV